MTLHLMDAGLKGQERAFDQRNRVISYVRFGGSRLSTAVPCILLTRKGSQVQTLSRPPQFSLVSALSVPSGQRS
jgi:hypothetical protein